MVMEYMCHGDLLGFLRTTRGHTDMYTVNPGTKNLPTNLRLTSRDLLSIIKQVATGMKFLSEQKVYSHFYYNDVNVISYCIIVLLRLQTDISPTLLVVVCTIIIITHCF